MRVLHGFYSHPPSRIPPVRVGPGNKKRSRHPFTPQIRRSVRQLSVKSASLQLCPNREIVQIRQDK
eukprot:8171352-Pyramimonas_sp.AAC.1